MCACIRTVLRALLKFFYGIHDPLIYQNIVLGAHIVVIVRLRARFMAQSVGRDNEASG